MSTDRPSKIEPCQWCGGYTRKPCQCPADVEIDRLRATLIELRGVVSHAADELEEVDDETAQAQAKALRDGLDSNI